MYPSETGLARATVNGLVSYIGPVGKFCIPSGGAFCDCLYHGLADFLQQPVDMMGFMLYRDASSEQPKIRDKIRRGLDYACEPRIEGDPLVMRMVSNSDERVAGIDFHWIFRKGDVGRLSEKERQELENDAREYYTEDEMRQLKDIAICMIPHIREKISTVEACVV
ncbi:hypothetical protein HYV88_02060 [Candidatus Woesearchaeota archaeon]|nr:hypothetical protein [Candidatus Woesearchaeota archaeon]